MRVSPMTPGRDPCRLGGLHREGRGRLSVEKRRFLRRGPLESPDPQCNLRHLGIRRALAPGHHTEREDREGAAVVELTELVDLSDWPEGTRLIVRREPLHPGAQHSLFPSLAYRYWGVSPDQA